jgi:peptidyl-tRNA hydrolase
MKQIIVVNNSLKLPRAKPTAQVAHPAVAAFLNAGDAARHAWLSDGMQPR